MRLLIITPKYDINSSNLGAFVGWWDRLARRMDKISILAFEKHSEPTKSNMEVLNIVRKEEEISFLRKFFRFYSYLFKAVKKTDAILVHMIPKYVIFSAPIALIFRKPIYLWYTEHVLRWDLRLAVFFCRKIFTAHETAMRVNTPKRIITGHGIDTNLFQISNFRSPISTVTILSVGRIIPVKGHDLVIKAIVDLIKSGYNIKLQIIGDDIQKFHQKYADVLKKLAVDSGVEDRVKFIGAIHYEKMPEYLTNAEIIINAVPFFGGLDKAVLEAMASGVVPLTSNNAFLSVLPKNFVSQLVFEENNLEDLKNKLKNILDKKLYFDKTLTNQLRDIVIRNHNLDNLITRIIKEMS